MTEHVDYDDRQWAVYEQGRALSPERARFWAEILGRHVPRGSTVLDLGAGTGVYSELMAEALDANVIAVEPSARMREVAEREHAHPRVRYLDGSAEAIPADAGSCDVALLSNVIHHVRDRERCAAELHRVLRPSGLVLVRGTLRGGRRIPFLDFFPAARRIAGERIPSPGEVVEMLSGRFEHVASEVIDQETAPSFREYTERVATRAISVLEQLDDEEFEAGLARMRERAAAETDPAPVVEQLDLVVLRRAAG